VELLKSASTGDQVGFRKTAESIIQEEKSKVHRILGDRLTKALRPNVIAMSNNPMAKQNGSNG